MSGKIGFFSRPLAMLLIATQVLLPLSASADISQLPPLVKKNVPPNVFYTLDDSGSMMFEVMPDNVLPYGDDRDLANSDRLPERTWDTTNMYSYCRRACWVNFMFPSQQGVYSTKNYTGRSAVSVYFNDNITVARLRSARLNKSYYDPATRYIPWVDQNTISASNPYGLPMANADPTRAQYNPVKAIGRNMDLTSTNTETTYWLSDDALTASSEEKSYYPATYYIYSPRSTLVSSDPACTGANISESNLNCFTRIEIRSTSGEFTPANFARAATRTDCKATAGFCTYTEEMQNFANWFQYYRSRVLMARGASAAAFAVQPTSLRVGFGAINTKDTVVVDINDDFSELNKRSFITHLYNHTIETNGTPLVKSVDDVGRYFKDQLGGRSGVNSPWYSKTDRSAAACRQSYNILMTDGYWSEGEGNGASAGTVGNWDGLAGPVIKGVTYRYNMERPYVDKEHSDTLADIAFYYWSNDLRTDLANVVPLPRDGSDIANWQHVVQFTVGLGVEGSLNSKTDLPALTSGDKVWPNPLSGDSYKIDDLWHAAVNSRGRFFSASNPVEFSQALAQSLNDIASRSGDAAAIATSNNTLGSGLKMYTASYRTGDWSGRLEQKAIYYNNTNPTDPANGRVEEVDDWDTDLIVQPTTRNIVTTSETGKGGVDFLYNNLTAAQREIFDTAAATFTASSAVDGTHLVNYIRGDKTREGDPFRKRIYWLGDLVNSDPQYLKEGRDDGYIFLPSGSVGKNSYTKFLNRMKDPITGRAPTVFVGSNDGMLHAFAATTDSTKGQERFAFIPSAVVSNLPELAKPTYSHRFYVDGTPFIGDAAIGSDPDNPWRTVLVGSTGAGGKSIFALDVTDPTNFTKDNVLWEKTGVGDADMGYTIGVPQIGRMKNGTWVAVFGNGFSSVNGVATLYVLNLKTGEEIKVSTGAGSRGAPNGLSTPKLLVGPDATIVAAYAGDIAGNLWKFDFKTTGDATTPSVALGGKPLFVATEDRRNQPITTQPQLYPHPQDGYMVVFGTGKIFEDTDAASTATESLYGVWDKVVSTEVKYDDLVPQTLNFAKDSFDFYEVKSQVIDWETKRGWRLSMDKSVGERLVTDPNIFEDMAIFTTLIPGVGGNACTSDGRSATIQISPLNGGALGYKTFDTNGDGQVDKDDTMVSGRIGDATFGTTIIRAGNRNLKQYQAASKDGSVAKSAGKASDLIPTARLWRQLLGRP